MREWWWLALCSSCSSIIMMTCCWSAPQVSCANCPLFLRNTAALTRHAQRRRHALAGCSQGPFLHHSSADCGFQWMLPLWNSSCSFGRHSRGHFRRSSHPLTTFALAGLAAFRASAHPTCVHAVSPSRFQSLSPCGQFPNVRTMPFNVSCLVRRRRQGETLKERESGLP